MTAGRFRWLKLAVVLWLSGSLGFGEVVPPSELLGQLASESFPERVEAEQELLKWADRTGDDGLAWLFRAAGRDPDPEVRGRAFSVLRRQAMSELEENRPGFIGITMLAASLEFEGATLPAVRITSVQEDSPAAEAGLRPGDAILSLDGERWQAGDTPEQLALKVGAMKPGREIKLEVLRDGETKAFSLKLAPRPWSAGEWGDFRQMRINPFNTRLSPGNFEENAREAAFQRWLEEKAPELRRR